MQKTLRQKISNIERKAGNFIYDVLATDVNKKDLAKLVLAGILGLGLVGCVTPTAAGRKNIDFFGRIITRTVIEESVKKELGNNDYQKRGNQTINHTTGEIHSVWMNHNIYQNGEKGMNIHTQFTIYNHQGFPTNLAAYFYHKNGGKLMDVDGIKTTHNGQVATKSEVLIPNYKNTHYKDVNMFIPYNQLDFPASGKHNLKFHVNLIDFSGNTPRHLSRSGWNHFWINNQ